MIFQAKESSERSLPRVRPAGSSGRIRLNQISSSPVLFVNYVWLEFLGLRDYPQTGSNGGELKKLDSVRSELTQKATQKASTKNRKRIYNYL